MRRAPSGTDLRCPPDAWTGWKQPRVVADSPAEVPKHVVSRLCFRELRHLRDALVRSQQPWRRTTRRLFPLVAMHQPVSEYRLAHEMRLAAILACETVGFPRSNGQHGRGFSQYSRPRRLFPWLNPQMYGKTYIIQQLTEIRLSNVSASADRILLDRRLRR